MRSASPLRPAPSCTIRCARWWGPSRWSEPGAGAPKRSAWRWRPGIGPAAGRPPPPAACISWASITDAASGREVGAQDASVDRRQTIEIGNGDALVHLVHGLADKAELEHRTV